MKLHITETVFRQYANAQSYDRGQNYFLSGSVFNIQRRGERFTAEVEGSAYDPYQVNVTDEGPARPQI
jgi:uncharacterized Zn finger protein